MDINVFRGIVTGVLLVLFIGLVIWAYGKGRKQAFDEAARIPLDDSPGPAEDHNKSDKP